MEVGDIVQEAVFNTTPKKKKCKKSKWLFEKALQLAEKKRDDKGKGEKDRYTHLNADFQGIIRRDKKAFLSDQCKEIEETNRMRKARYLLKKIGDTESHFLGRLIRSLGVPKEREVWDIQGGRKDKPFSFFPLHSLGLYNNNVSCLRTVFGLNPLANSVILKHKLWE